jgi:hypothetical protein
VLPRAHVLLCTNGTWARREEKEERTTSRGGAAAAVGDQGGGAAPPDTGGEGEIRIGGGGRERIGHKLRRLGLAILYHTVKMTGWLRLARGKIYRLVISDLPGGLVRLRLLYL